MCYFCIWEYANNAEIVMWNDYGDNVDCGNGAVIFQCYSDSVGLEEELGVKKTRDH